MFSKFNDQTFIMQISRKSPKTAQGIRYKSMFLSGNDTPLRGQFQKHDANISDAMLNVALFVTM